MAITLVVFVMLILGIAEMMRLLYAYITTGHLAREAVRYAVVRGNLAAQDESRISGSPPDAPANKARIEALINGKGLLSPLTVTACWPFDPDAAGATCSGNSPALAEGENNLPGMPVRITVTYQYQPLVVPELMWFGPKALSTSSQGTILY
jgi:Flp pilus assembly protein TadG